MALSPAYRFGIYEKALRPQALPKMFDDAARTGYENFEISLDETDQRLERLDWSASRLNRIRKAAQDSGIQLFSACLSGGRRYPLGSADPLTEMLALNLLSKAISFCTALGIRVLQLSGFDVYYEPHSEETSKRYLENLIIGTEIAAKAGVMLAIEPVEGHIVSIRDALVFVKKVDSPWLKVYPDVANLLAMGFDPVSELAYGQGNLVGLHIRDAIPGTSYNIPWGAGTLDFIGVFTQLQKMKFSSPILVEYWYEDGDDYLERARFSREFLLRQIAMASVRQPNEEEKRDHV